MYVSVRLSGNLNLNIQNIKRLYICTRKQYIRAYTYVYMRIYICIAYADFRKRTRTHTHDIRAQYIYTHTHIYIYAYTYIAWMHWCVCIILLFSARWAEEKVCIMYILYMTELPDGNLLQKNLSFCHLMAPSGRPRVGPHESWLWCRRSRHR